MPLDVLGCTRATMGGRVRYLRRTAVGNRAKPLTSGIGPCKTGRQRGISSSHGSLARGDYVPALCTHRPSLLPIGPDDEDHGALSLNFTV